MKSLIVVIGDNKYQFDTKEELLQNLLGAPKDDYNTMTEEEKKKRRYLKAYINAKGNEEKIVDLQEQMKQSRGNVDIDEKFLIDNDDVYVMSLLNMTDVILLEKKDTNFFTKGINKRGIEDNYLVLNGYASEIIEKYKQECIKNKEELEK